MRVYLRDLTLSDVTDKYVSWLNDPDVNRYLGLSKELFQTIETVRAFVESKNAMSECVFKRIFLSGTHEHVGNIKIEKITLLGRETYGLGMIIGEKRYWNGGIGGDALRLMLDECKREELMLAVNRENVNAIKLYERVGFRRCGRDGELLYYERCRE